MEAYGENESVRWQRHYDAGEGGGICASACALGKSEAKGTGKQDERVIPICKVLEGACYL